MPIFQDSIHWKVTSIGFDLTTGQSIINQSDFYSETALLVLDNKEYRKITVRNRQNDDYFFREDSAAQKIYVRSADDDREYIAYDYKLKIGDTFNPFVFNYDRNFSQSWSPYLITDIDEVTFQGINRKRIHLENLDCQGNCPSRLKWIEGVGSDYCINYFDQNYNSSNLDGPVYRLSCTFRSGILIYSEDQTCFSNTADQDFFNSPLNVFPNPSTGNFFIRNKGNERFKMVLKIWQGKQF